MNICVFCSAQDAAEKYTKAAQELATLIGKHGHTLVWGGSNIGTMKTIADAAQASGARLVGISVEKYKANARPEADEMVVKATLSERKAEILARSDVFVVLPGGLGTLDEITEVLELKKQDKHQKTIVFLNTDGFYEGFKMQLERMNTENFLPRPLPEYLYFADTPAEAFAHIETAV